ncbi:YjcZ family sporulation protein [Neobacillus sp. NPDC058068]
MEFEERRNPFALIVVLFVLLIIVGTSFMVGY